MDGWTSSSRQNVTDIDGRTETPTHTHTVSNTHTDADMTKQTHRHGQI